MATLMTMFAATFGFAAPASAAPLFCWPTSGPAQYSGTPGSSILGWGQYSCSKSVDWIYIEVTMQRDGIQVFHDAYRATRLPGNGLVNVLRLFSVPCVTGGYVTYTRGTAPGLGISESISPPDYLSCGAV